MNLIELKDVTFTYKGESKPAVEDITLEVREGESLCIMGPSGCGKTTLCYILSGVIPFLVEGDFKGEVLYRGENAHRVREKRGYLGVGLVLQDPESQLISLKVERELAFGPENIGLPPQIIRERVMEAAEALGISHLLDRSTYELSGGELQRVAIGSLLTLYPEVLIFDEPTSNLDHHGLHSLKEMLKALKQRGYTIVVVEHDVEHLLEVFDRIVLMSNGRILISGEPVEALLSREAEKAGVSIPLPLRLYKELRKKGVKLPKPPLTVQELLELLGDVVGRAPTP